MRAFKNTETVYESQKPQIDPILITRSDKGEIEGVKYGQLTPVLVNAVNEEQVQIEQKQKQIQQQQRAIADLRELVCRQNRTVAQCQEKQ